MTKQEVEKLSDKDLLELEHDNEVDLLDDLSFTKILYDIDKWTNEEIEKRGLTKLKRLNGFS